MQNPGHGANVRLPDEELQAVELAAAESGRTIEEILVEAFHEWKRRRDKSVLEAARESMDKNTEALARLAK
jgi:hypothetical protein